MRLREIITRASLAICLLFWTAAAQAQGLSQDLAEESDRGFIAGLLEQALGGDGREVRVFGFQGALSSTAQIERITIADADGVWLSMDGLVMEWNRRALLRGQIDITALTASEITLARAPQAEPNALPDAEAQGFALPNLPVSIDIRRVEVDRFNLGAPLLGRAAALALAASAVYTDERLALRFDARRIDGPQGAFAVDGAFARGEDSLALTLSLTEAANGLAADLLALPGAPSINLQVAGIGPLDDYRLRLDLDTDGADRVDGTLRLTEAEDTSARRFDVDVRGDLAPLVATEIRPFFGSATTLKAQGTRAGSGALNLQTLALRTDVLDLSGTLRLAANGWPEAATLDVLVSDDSGQPVVLPVTGGLSHVDRAAAALTYDVQAGDDWQVDGTITGLRTEALVAETLQLTGRGRLTERSGVAGRFDMTAQALEFASDAVQKAVGPSVQVAVSLRARPGLPVELNELSVAGDDYRLTGDVTIAGLDDSFETALAVQLAADDLARFDALAGSSVRGAANLALEGTVDLGGAFAVTLDGTARGLAVGIEQIDGLLTGETALSARAERDSAGTRLPRFALSNPQLNVTAAATLSSAASDVTFDLSIPDGSVIDPLLQGAVTLDGAATGRGDTWSIAARATAPYDSVATLNGAVTGPTPLIDFDLMLPDVAPLVPDLRGPLRLGGTARPTPDGWVLDTDMSGPFETRAAVTGRVSGDNAPDVNFELSLPDVAALAPGISGPATVAGRAQMQAEGLMIDTSVAAPFGTTGTITGRATGASAPDLRFDLAIRDLDQVVPDLSGTAQIAGRAYMAPDGLTVDTSLSGPLGASGTVTGRVAGSNAPDVAFDVSVPSIGPLVPALPGPAGLSGRAQQTEDGLIVDTSFRGPSGMTGTVSGRATGANPSLEFGLALPNIASLGSPVGGPLSVTGQVSQNQGAWRIATELNGPGGAAARLGGTVVDAQSVNLDATGRIPLALTTPLIAPRSLQGTAEFDLSLAGAPELNTLSGQISARGARLSAPSAAIALEDLDTDIRLAAGRATITAAGAVSSGGRIAVQGELGLTGALPADLTAQLNTVRLTDPSLYDTRVDGRVSLRGPLSGGAQIGGQIDIGETQVQVPTAPGGGFAIVPEITHVGPSAAVRQTLSRAGLDTKAETSRANTGPGYGLDLIIRAPSRIFVRGRGLDAELGGQVALRGTTNAVASVGQFSLIRGRLDVLGKRFVLDEGDVRLQGQLDPFIRFVASTSTQAGSARVIIEGQATSPEVRFEATPEAPQDEVLAQIFFGRSLATLSPFQALQLASAVAQLAGQGGEGLVSRLRRSFDLDDLDVTTDEDGGTGLRFGKYISDNVYTDVTVGNSNDAGVSLNIDLTPNLTARGTQRADGESSIGIFFERDY